MSDDSKIEWTDATWNPIRGCSRESEGCRHCYAERVAVRFSGPGQPYEGLVRISNTLDGRKPTGWNGTVRMVAEHLADPLRWRRPRRVFVNSMSDLFHESLTNEQIAAVFGVMAAAPQHTFQVLTKRARRMREWFGWIASQGDVVRVMCDSLVAHDADGGPAISKIMLGPTRRDWQPVPVEQRGMNPWPLPNVWLGVSVENQAAADERIPELLATPAAVRWISAEPLLGAVDLGLPRTWLVGATARKILRDTGARGAVPAHLQPPPSLDWLVMGAESGPGSRAADPAWFRGLAEQCRSAGVSVFFKQGMPGDGVTAGPGSIAKRGGLIGLPYLDGVQHAAFPEVPRG